METYLFFVQLESDEFRIKYPSPEMQRSLKFQDFSVVATVNKVHIVE